MTRTYNISLIGDSATGKTSIANALCLESEFSNEYTPTIGASMLKIPFQDGEKTIWYYFWDTAGMETYRSLAPVYYRDSSLAIIVYDITSKKSFDSVDEWRNLYLSTVGEGFPTVIVGNKIDLEEQREVSTEDGEGKALSMNSKFIETSAKTKKNIPQILEIITEILKNQEANSVSNNGLQEQYRTTECC